MIGIFYGSTNGNTAAVAEFIRTILEQEHGLEAELLDVADCDLEEMLAYDPVVVGIPTWNVGQLQRDWEEALDELDELDLSGKHAAVFGLGDQVGYPATFADAMIFIAEKMEAQGARLVGAWPTTGYHFTGSWAVRNGAFVGLVVDEDNQPEQTEARVRRWVAQLVAELGPAVHTPHTPHTPKGIANG